MGAASRQNSGAGGCGGRRKNGEARDAGVDVGADEVDDGVDVDALGHVGDEPYERRHAHEGEEDGDGQRQVRDELALVCRAHRAQHQESVDEGADEGAERDLVAAIAGEIAQKARAHLSRGEGQRRDGDREHRAGDGDGRRGYGAEYRACSGRTAAIEPGVLDEALRCGLDVIDADEHVGGDDAGEDHQSGNNPERVAEIVENLAVASDHGSTPAAVPYRTPSLYSSLPRANSRIASRRPLGFGQRISTGEPMRPNRCLRR